MSTTVGLAQMVDLALGTPEVGAVNFNVLHTLLHAVIQKLDLSNVKANIKDEDKDFLTRKKSDTNLRDPDEADSAVTGLTDQTFSSGLATGSKAPYHQLIDKVSKLEKQLQDLNALPSNAELLERTGVQGDSQSVRPVTDMWQNMQLTKRVDTNEEGISKLMSLVQDLMEEMNQLKDENKQMKKQLDEGLADMSKLSNLDDMMKRLAELETQMNSLNDKLSAYPDMDVFENYVTWESLEDALKGLRTAMESLQNTEPAPRAPTPRVVVDMSNQVNMSRPASCKSRASTPGPSSELMDILERLGRLNDRHDLLDERVTVVEDELKKKKVPTATLR